MNEVACESVGREPKMNRLTRIINDLNEIRDHIQDIHSQIGARSLPCEAKTQEQPELPLSSLVDVLDNLPDIARRQVSNIHGLLDEIKDSLI